MTERSRFVVSPDWLESHLGDPNLRIVDASWYLPAQNRDATAEYLQSHIPGSVFFDQDRIAEPGSDLPHTLPSPDVFARFAGALGLSDTNTIVVYDGPGMFTAPRVWWMLRIMGAGDVFLLDGGFDNWKREGRPTDDASPVVMPAQFETRFDGSAVASLEMMLSIIDRGDVQIADARSPGRFEGTEPEPRDGMRSGHMPGAFNLPVISLSENGYLKDLVTLRSLFVEAGIDPARPVVTTCGSGVTAAVITLALESLGYSDNMLYDGSWSQWGSLPDTPVETGKRQ